MPKYDDFGRPIYETAEEYNRAHKTSGSNVTHNQTAAQRHAMRTGSKKAKSLVTGLVAFIIAINVVVALLAFNTVGVRYEEAIPETALAVLVDDYYDEFLGDTDTPLPEGFEKFIYNGDAFVLPVQYEEFAKLGYYIEDYDEKEIVPAGFFDVMVLYEEDGWSVAQISVSNHTQEDMPLEKCMVEYIYIYNPVPYDEEQEPTDFVFGSEISFESSYEEVEALLGTPYHHYKEHSNEDYHYDSYEWAYYGTGEVHYVMANFVNGKMSDISIEKNIY